jgi:hypothetical protein
MARVESYCGFCTREKGRLNMTDRIDVTANPTSKRTARKMWYEGARVRLGAIIAIAVAAGFVAWVVIGSEDDSPSTSANPPAAVAAPGTGPAALSVSGLSNFARSVDQPIYWAGPRPGHTYELTQTSNGNVYVRYLPPGVQGGAKGSNFLIVVTYPYNKAFEALQRVSGGRAVQVPAKGIAVVDEGYPKSVHMAFRGVNYQVEVYHSSPQRARQVAVSGDIRPVR